MILLGGTIGLLFEAVPSIVQRFCIRLAAVVATALALSVFAQALGAQMSGAQSGQIMGTVMDVNGDAVTDAAVVLGGPETAGRRTVATTDNGFFKFDDVKPRVPYQIVISAEGFADWTSPAITIDPGEIKMLGAVQLALATQQTTVQVTDNSAEIATEQVKFEEMQRVLGIIPNFYVSYEGDNAAPLTTKMKFKLALKVSHDPVTVAGVGFMAGIKQTANTADYGQGAKGYAERFGATAADGLTDIMIGGAILPSLLHQDPRYFYLGTGTTRSRLRHAILSPFTCKGDDGRRQPNYSSMGGDLASAALSNLDYPQPNRGAGTVFSTFAIGTAERIASTVAQEFLLGKFTYRGGHVN
jgi:hypothetical protein